MLVNDMLDAMAGKIALVLPYGEGFSKTHAGAVALTVSEQIKWSNHDLTVIGNVEAFEPLIPNAYLKIEEGFWPPFGPSRWRLDRSLRSLLSDISPQLVEIHVKAKMFLRLAGIPYRMAFYIHGDPLTSSGTETVRSRLKIVQRADYVIAVSEFVKERFCTGLPSELCSKVHVIYNAVPFDGYEVSTKKKEVVFIGRFNRAKGVEQLIRALISVLPEFPDWRAAVVGATTFGQKRLSLPFEVEMMNLARDFHESISFLGYQPAEIVKKILSTAAIAVVPSLCREAFGRTALESMIAGCAVVGSNRGGLPEVIGDAGILIDPTVENIADALRRLMSDPIYCAEVGHRCAARARSEFNPLLIHSRVNEMRRSVASIAFEKQHASPLGRYV